MAPSASAAAAGAYGCAGNQIDSYQVKTSGGAVYGNIYLYYDSSTGKNCAVNVATSAGAYGKPTFKFVMLVKCVAGTSAGSTCVQDTYIQDPTNTGVNYSQYAGPVSISAAGRCISVTGIISLSSGPTSSQAAYTGNATHCG
ncbi:hypothetical protein [Streptomyces nitrosporeus]|uniref:Spore-associated protein A n=1 Tax=Streptomyces nitrosporeus TaxID=28894 RepID=A0A5J6FF95_9ACTN|nr:hypothetical protein [Streptomyces nitrosporeus]QEU74751.1 hypothetical protein CP967_24665 [Streptomyces nitrosporeus]GGY85603.1 hypothetical protein GCM10010327_15280 [Streptomyces nitrosporeus]